MQLNKTLLSRVRYESARRGISLLEVLISIGILGIGLTAVLSLIPAGRTLMQKAAVDDRAAALVPNAWSTMQTLGLFGKDSLSWRAANLEQVTYRENSNNPSSADGPVIREQRGVDVFALPSNGTTRNDTGDAAGTSDAGWMIETRDSEVITAWHAQDAAPLKIAGTVPPVTDPEKPATSVTVTGSFQNPDNPGFPSTGIVIPTQSVMANRDTGAWEVFVTPNPLPADDVRIHETGGQLGTQRNSAFVDYTFRATFVGSDGEVLNANPTPSSFRQYGRRRSQDLRRGKARTWLDLPASARRDNETPDAAFTLPIGQLESATQKRGEIIREASVEVRDTLWRMDVGARRSTYEQYWSFANSNNAPGVAQSIQFQDADISSNDIGYAWLNGATESLTPPNPAQEDVDWFKLSVEAGQVLLLEWTDSDGVLATTPRVMPVYLNGSSNLLAPFEEGSGFAKYSIPNDGFILTKASLRPDLVNTFGPAGTSRSFRRNPEYRLKATVSRSERVVVVDPLMATRLDKIIQLSNATRTSPYGIRRERFADFQQQFAGSNSARAFVIPRLNWQRFTSGDIDIKLAMAERLFRDEDSLAIDPPPGDDAAPEPQFDLLVQNSGTTPLRPLRRQASGRMSWLLMLQPEDAGPVASNWAEGKYFDVSVVIFEDRKLPNPKAYPALAPNEPLEGEYSLQGSWSDLTGMISFIVPPALNLEDDDVRQLFRTGSWILLAPYVTYESSPADSRQRLQWVKIQSAEMERQANGMAVRILPEVEPGSDVLLRSSTPVVESPIVVLAYHGVVAVVNKSVRLGP